MSEYHRSRMRYNVPDLSGVYSQINSLNQQNTRLHHQLHQSESNYHDLANEMRGINSTQGRLAGVMRQTQNAVSSLAGEQRNLQYQQNTIVNGLSRAERNMGALYQAQNTLNAEMSSVQQEQQHQQQRLSTLDQQIGTLDHQVGGLSREQVLLRQQLDQQRREVREELGCLRDYQQFLGEQLQGCQQNIQDLTRVTSDLQRQQNQTAQILEQVSSYATEVHQQLNAFEERVEERHRQAQEDLRRQGLQAAQAHQMLQSNLELLDRRQIERFGILAELHEVEGLQRQAQSHANDPAMQNAAAAQFCIASEKCMSLHRRIQQKLEEQIQRESRIRNTLQQAGAIANNWRDDKHIKFYREEELNNLQTNCRDLEQLLEGLAHVHGDRELVEQTATLEQRAHTLCDQAIRYDEEEFPAFVSKCEQRLRFLTAIRQGILDTFTRAGQRAQIKSTPVLADPTDRLSALRFAAGSEARTVIVEVDLEGNCHFWWEGYPEKTHVQDIEQFENHIRKGRELEFQLNSPRAFRGEPKYEPPPETIKLPIKKRTGIDVRLTPDRDANTKTDTKRKDIIN